MTFLDREFTFTLLQTLKDKNQSHFLTPFALVSDFMEEGHLPQTLTYSEDRGTADRGQKSRTAFALDSSSLHQQHQ